MKKRMLIASLCILGSVLVASHSASADVRVNASVNTGHTAISFESEPDVVIVPHSRVYYYEAPSEDVYRYGSAWWVDREGTWYRATSYHGPFYRVSYERVPHQIVVIPADYHRHDNGLHRGWEKHHGEHEHGHHDAD